MPNEEKLVCHRCESKEPAKIYDPKTPGYPHKRINLCCKCAAADPKAVLADDGVPTIDPPVTLPAEVVAETIPTPISPGIPLSAPPVQALERKSVESTPVKTEPIARQTVKDQIALRKANLKKLDESRQAILAEAKVNNERAKEINNKLTQCDNVILITKGALAALQSVDNKG